MTPETVIRTASRADLSAVLQLWDRVSVTPKVTDSIEALTHLLNHPGGILLVATIDDRIVGSVIGGWDGWRGNIYRLAVSPDHRRKGIAQRLVKEISIALCSKGAQRLSALVEHEHPWAVNFWNSMRDLGFEHDPTLIRYKADRPARKTDQVRML
ncbi:MAG: GNAT family N-acetyltransferase [Candidatus Binatus sp.]